MSGSHFCRRLCCHGYNGINIWKITFPTYNRYASNVHGNDSWRNVESTDGSNKSDLRNIGRHVLIYFFNRIGEKLLLHNILKRKMCISLQNLVTASIYIIYIFWCYTVSPRSLHACSIFACMLARSLHEELVLIDVFAQYDFIICLVTWTTKFKIRGKEQMALTRPS